MRQKLSARLSREERRGAVIVRSMAEVQRVLALIELRLEEGSFPQASFPQNRVPVTKPEPTAPQSEACVALSSALQETVRAAVHADMDGAEAACAHIAEVLKTHLALEPPSAAERAETAMGELAALGKDLVRDLEDAVLRYLAGQPPEEQAAWEDGGLWAAPVDCLPAEVAGVHGLVTAVFQVGKCLQLRCHPAASGDLLSRLERPAREALEMLQVSRSPGEKWDSDPFLPLCETDTVILNYVDLVLLRAKYGHGRVPGTTLAVIARRGFGFGDLVRHYLREDLPSWFEREFALDLRQAQLAAAAISSVNETYRLFTTRGDKVRLHRDVVVKTLLCEDNFCKR